MKNNFIQKSIKLYIGFVTCRYSLVVKKKFMQKKKPIQLNIGWNCEHVDILQ